MAARTTIVTGGNSGLGYHCAKAIGEAIPDNVIVVASRDPARVEAAVLRLRQDVPAATFRGMRLDLAAFASIRQFARDLADGALPPIGALVCNAGVQIVTTTARTADGIELTFGVNHLGHFLLANLLLPAMASDGRIVFVSSDTHDPATYTGMPAPAYTTAHALAHPAPPAADLSIADLGRQRYTTSKLCNILCAYEFARRLRQAGSSVCVNAFNPGLMLDTGLVRDYSLQEMFMLTVRKLPRFLPQMLRFRNARKMGAALAWLATDESLATVSGAYFDGTARIESSTESRDLARAAELWQASRELSALSSVESAL